MKMPQNTYQLTLGVQSSCAVPKMKLLPTNQMMITTLSRIGNSTLIELVIATKYEQSGWSKLYMQKISPVKSLHGSSQKSLLIPSESSMCQMPSKICS
jgi:hypothetical protein